MRVSVLNTKSTHDCSIPLIDGDGVDTDEEMKAAEPELGLAEVCAERDGDEEEANWPFDVVKGPAESEGAELES